MGQAPLQEALSALKLIELLPLLTVPKPLLIASERYPFALERDALHLQIALETKRHALSFLSPGQQLYDVGPSPTDR